jgi:hypothetical protein
MASTPLLELDQVYKKAEDRRRVLVNAAVASVQDKMIDVMALTPTCRGFEWHYHNFVWQFLDDEEVYVPEFIEKLREVNIDARIEKHWSWLPWCNDFRILHVSWPLLSQ